jgi:hypothetical protein
MPILFACAFIDAATTFVLTVKRRRMLLYITHSEASSAANALV